MNGWIKLTIITSTRDVIDKTDKNSNFDIGTCSERQQQQQG